MYRPQAKIQTCICHQCRGQTLYTSLSTTRGMGYKLRTSATQTGAHRHRQQPYTAHITLTVNFSFHAHPTTTRGCPDYTVKTPTHTTYLTKDAQNYTSLSIYGLTSQVHVEPPPLEQQLNVTAPFPPPHRPAQRRQLAAAVRPKGPAVLKAHVHSWRVDK